MKRVNETKQTFQRTDQPTAVPRLIEDGVEVTDEALWVWLHIPDGSTQLLEDDELSRATLDTSAALGNLLPSGAEYHIKVMWAAASSADYRASWQQVDSVRAPGAEHYVDLGAHRIDRNVESGFFRRRVVLLGLRWPNAGGSSAAARTRRAARQLRSQQVTVKQARERLDAVRADVDRWIRRMADSPLRAERAGAGLITWAYSREMRRGVLLDIPDGSSFSGSGLVNLMHGEIDPTIDDSYVVVTDKRTGYRRYVSVLVPAVNGFPVDELEIPGGEWLEMLTELPGVEASVRGVNHGQAGSISRLDNARKTARSQEREAGQHGADVPVEVAAANERLSERRQEVARRLDVMTTNHARWIVDAASPQELADRIAEVQQRYTGTVRLEVVPHVQRLLWQEILPGDQVRVPEFAQEQPMRTLAGSWFHGGSAVGDNTGPYMGANLGSTPGPVQLHFVSRAEQHRGQPTTITFTGKSGSGKSTGVMLSSLGVLAEGAWEILVDPKGDLGGIVPVAEQVLGVPVQVVDILDESCSGMMDPMRFAASADDARGLTLDALLGALSADDRRRAELVLERAIDAVLARERDRWSCPAVIGELVATPENAAESAVARQIGETLALRAKLAALRPVLGPLSEHAQALLGGRGLVYLGLSGLDLPRHNPDPDKWTISERGSMTTFRVSMAYALHQSRHARQLKKVVALTELHLLTGYPEGRSFVEWIGRTGRALQIWQLLDSQSAVDLAEITALIEQIVMSFAFQADGKAEQDAQSVLLHRPEPGPRLRDAQAGLAAGECVMRDRTGRLGLVAFDRLTTGIAEALRTDADEDTGEYHDAATPEANDTGQTVLTGTVPTTSYLADAAGTEQQS